MIAWPAEVLSEMDHTPRNPIILPLDTPDAEKAVNTVRLMREDVGAFKVGLELVHAAGPSIFSRLREAGADRLFYDAKLCDIPNTVAGACRVIGEWGLWMVNVHALGGLAMMRAARAALNEGAERAGMPPPLIIAVTLLTSLDDNAVRDELGLPGGLSSGVVRLAKLAREAGMDGVVASALEAETLRQECGPEFLIVTPGIRPAGAAAADQRRIATPAQALAAGADYLVVGRSLTESTDPPAAARSLLAEARGR
jgi:orotidine-5'-phosphate decarboxylase